MKPFEGEWQAWDLIIDDLSTMRNYREQFKTILETKTLTELIEILKKKA
jgi:phospholipid transport system substrate-binding protein